MKPEAAEALEKSIAKWEGYLEAESVLSVYLGPHNCPLCWLFHSKDCDGCPVKESTGKLGCVDTPYDDAVVARWVGRAQFHAAAKREIAFLKSLREPVE